MVVLSGYVQQSEDMPLSPSIGVVAATRNDVVVANAWQFVISFVDLRFTIYDLLLW
jgi:hypothetical protein